MKHLPTKLIEATLKFELVIREEPFGNEPLVFFLGTYLRLYFCFSEYFLFSFFGWERGRGRILLNCWLCTWAKHKWQNKWMLKQSQMLSSLHPLGRCSPLQKFRTPCYRSVSQKWLSNLLPKWFWQRPRLHGQSTQLHSLRCEICPLSSESNTFHPPTHTST